MNIRELIELLEPFAKENPRALVAIGDYRCACVRDLDSITPLPNFAAVILAPRCGPALDLEAITGGRTR